MPSPSPDLLGGDYESIAAAVQETPRGRWFLAEYARRNRQADTQMLLDAIGRLENAICGQGSLPAGTDIRAGLASLAARIANTRKEIAAGLGEGTHRRNDGADELDGVALAAESATSDILAAAEHVQETAWTLREQGISPATCDFLDAQATDIYAACSQQDLAGQQLRRIIDLLRHLDGKISAMTVSAMTDIRGANPASSEPIKMVADAPPLSQHDDDLALSAGDADTPDSDDPFAALRTLSAEETIALFT
ncbi:MAG: hypothetical protein AB7O60_11505 [Variibacter sp.]